MAISRGFRSASGVYGCLFLICALVMGVPAIIMNQKSISLAVASGYFDYFSYTNALKSTWWGGAYFLLPALSGVYAGASQQPAWMVLFLVFSILGIFASIGFSIYMAFAYIMWAPIAYGLEESACNDVSGICICAISSGTIQVENTECSSMMNVYICLMCIMAGTGFACIMSMVASYTSCCAFCNQQPEHSNTIIMQSGSGIANPNYDMSMQAQYQPNPPQYTPFHATNDTSVLVKSQVI